MVEKDPTVMRWPIVVNHETRQVAFTQAGVRSVLRALVVERDKKFAKFAHPNLLPNVRLPRKRGVDCESWVVFSSS